MSDSSRLTLERRGTILRDRRAEARLVIPAPVVTRHVEPAEVDRLWRKLAWNFAHLGDEYGHTAATPNGWTPPDYERPAPHVVFAMKTAGKRPRFGDLEPEDRTADALAAVAA
jgi:hypothetical protein